MIRYNKSIRLKKYLKVNRFFMHLKYIIDLTISLLLIKLITLKIDL